MHGSSISKGNENRDQSNLDSYVDWLAQQIYEFVNKEIIIANNNSEILTLTTTSNYEE